MANDFNTNATKQFFAFNDTDVLSCCAGENDHSCSFTAANSAGDLLLTVTATKPATATWRVSKYSITDQDGNVAAGEVSIGTFIETVAAADFAAFDTSKEWRVWIYADSDEGDTKCYLDIIFDNL